MVAASLRERALSVLETVTDPEIPVLTIADLGILRDLAVHGDTVEVEVGGIGILRNSIYDPSVGSQVSG